MRRISFRSGTLTQASIWCCIIGNPATGNSGFGTSNDNGRNRVPEIYNDSLNGLKKGSFLTSYNKQNTVSINIPLDYYKIPDFDLSPQLSPPEIV